ncbi:MAG: toxin-antitoxin system HicB family antitoxin [Bacillota bacterium]|nr:toxin-antitoxin system HicB family antitoxin [Bacillota bacterium]
MTSKSVTADDYQILVRRIDADAGGGFFAHPIDLPGYGAWGESPESALSSCREVLVAALESDKEDGNPSPIPADYSPGAYSGKFIIRTPKSLHHKLALKAKAEGISLNQLCIYLLSEGLAAKTEAASNEIMEALVEWINKSGVHESGRQRQFGRSGFSRLPLPKFGLR